MSPVFLLLFLVSVLLLGLARLLAERRQRLLGFVQHPEYRLESFDEVVFGVTAGRLPEATSWVLLAATCLLLGGLGATSLGLSLLVLIRTAPMMVLPTVFFGYAAWIGWRSLGSQVGRVPVVRRLRLTQAHLVLDEVALGLDVTPDDIASTPPSRRARAIAWDAVTRVCLDDHDRLVIGARGEADAVFGPLSREVADDLVELIERRRAVRTEGGEVIDLARVRLRALTERIDRSRGPGDDA